MGFWVCWESGQTGTLVVRRCHFISDRQGLVPELQVRVLNLETTRWWLLDPRTVRGLTCTDLLYILMGYLDKHPYPFFCPKRSLSLLFPLHYHVE